MLPRVLATALASALLSLVQICVHGQTTSRHALLPADVTRIVRLANPVLSPDGLRLAYLVERSDAAADRTTSSIWWQSLNDGAPKELFAGGGSALQWTADGRQLSFLASGAGKTMGPQVWLADPRTGMVRQVTAIKEHLLAFAWSPDGKQLLLTIQDRDEPQDSERDVASLKPIVITRYQFKDDRDGYLTDQRQHLYLYEPTTGGLTRLLCEPGRDEERNAVWSPDGTRIAFLSQRDQAKPERTEASDLYVVPAQPGAIPQRLTGLDRSLIGPLVWSADGQRIAYRQARTPGYSSYTQYQLAVIAATGGAPRLYATSLDRQVGSPFFAQDGSALLTSVVDDRNVYVENVPLDGGAPQRVTHGQGVVDDLAYAAGQSVVLWSTDTSLPELYLVERSGALRAITHVNDAVSATLRLLPAEDLNTRTADGSEVHGLFTLPASYRAGSKVPLLLWIHGGPTSQDAHDFNLSRQIFAAHGYAVLNVNYHGSIGRGLAYSSAIQADWGDRELLDLEAMVDSVVAKGVIDPKKLAVGGWSYGAILTNALIAHTNRFRAASAGAGRGNLIGAYGVSEYVLQYDSELGQPWKHPNLYMKLSYPFFHADQIKTPTLYMGGDRDLNVPLAGSEQMYEALRSVGTPTELVIYPGQHHVFTRPSFVIDRYNRWFDWYDTYLGLKPTEDVSSATIPACPHPTEMESPR